MCAHVAGEQAVNVWEEGGSVALVLWFVTVLTVMTVFEIALSCSVVCQEQWRVRMMARGGLGGTCEGQREGRGEEEVPLDGQLGERAAVACRRSHIHGADWE
jgi:hypothetical protein